MWNISQCLTWQATGTLAFLLLNETHLSVWYAVLVEVSEQRASLIQTCLVTKSRYFNGIKKKFFASTLRFDKWQFLKDWLQCGTWNRAGGCFSYVSSWVCPALECLLAHACFVAAFGCCWRGVRQIFLSCPCQETHLSASPIHPWQWSVSHWQIQALQNSHLFLASLNFIMCNKWCHCCFPWVDSLTLFLFEEVAVKYSNLNIQFVWLLFFPVKMMFLRKWLV